MDKLIIKILDTNDPKIDEDKTAVVAIASLISGLAFGIIVLTIVVLFLLKRYYHINNLNQVYNC